MSLFGVVLYLGSIAYIDIDSILSYILYISLSNLKFFQIERDHSNINLNYKYNLKGEGRNINFLMRRNKK